jgi:hypothetical protein
LLVAVVPVAFSTLPPAATSIGRKTTKNDGLPHVLAKFGRRADRDKIGFRLTCRADRDSSSAM